MNKIKFKIFNALIALPIATIFLSSCSLDISNPLVFANFESYMSLDLQKRLLNNFKDLRFDYYASNENIITNFKNGTYSIGDASTYAVIELIKQDQLVPLNWSIFNLKNPITKESILTANDALSLFIPSVQKILTGYSNLGISNLLEYCVPYFLQTYIFAYRGDKISFQPNSNWDTILNVIGSNSAKFDSSKLGAVEDQRTLFSVANLVNSDQNMISVNPSSDTNLKPSINDYINIYKNLSNGKKINKSTLGTNPEPIFLNSDSSIILNKLAIGSLNGAMLFNGDAIFAAQGGENSLNNLPTSQNFHFVIPSFTPIALDCLVINKTNQINNKKRLEDVYDIIKTITLEGTDSNNPDEFETLENNIYKYGPMLNFSFVQYTSPLQIISGQEPNINSVVYTNNYFQNEKDPNLSEAIKMAYSVNVPIETDITNLVEAPLNAWQKQTIINAYLRFKNTEWS
ncbi:type 2 periplasmic-binding domain-containing protein [Mycoplasmoides alvi]|uniref:hypothetical protein n=1 Tax=Mycoplasmoides alvi TaxID=78580 RepID=UPI00051AC0FB|nr:hypothetical protein [Mycoplasmoides alvi]